MITKFPAQYRCSHMTGSFPLGSREILRYIRKRNQSDLGTRHENSRTGQYERRKVSAYCTLRGATQTFIGHA